MAGTPDPRRAATVAPPRRVDEGEPPASQPGACRPALLPEGPPRARCADGSARFGAPERIDAITLLNVHEAMTRRGWLLFGAMGVIWGIPYLLIKVAVEHVAPPVVVFGRTSLASALLLAIASRTGAARAALTRWRWVLAFAAIEMAVPWLALTDAERRLPSGLTGLLVACVPLFGTFIAYLLGDHTALRPAPLAGIAIGLGGVALLVGRDL